MGEKGLETGQGDVGTSAPIHATRLFRGSPVTGGEGSAQAPVTGGEPTTQRGGIAGVLQDALERAQREGLPPPEAGGMAGVMDREHPGWRG